MKIKNKLLVSMLALRSQGLVWALLYCLLVQVGWGDENSAPTSVYVQNAPFVNSPIQPSWLQFPTVTSTNFAQLNLQLVPPFPVGEQLLLTVIFDEQPNGFLKVYEQGASGGVTLSDNLMEGVSGANQRTLLLKDLSAGEPTLVTLQSGGAQLPVRRVILRWVKPQVILTDAANADVVAFRGSILLRDTDLSGGPIPGPSLKLLNNFVSVPLQTGPDDLTNGVNIVASLSELPSHVLIRGKLLGAILGQRVTCRINGQNVSDFVPYLESLLDPSYLWGDQPTYSSWAPTTVYCPGSLWQEGDNLIEIRVTSLDGQAGLGTVSLKDLEMELLYPEPSTGAVPDASNSSLPPVTTSSDTPASTSDAK